MTADDLCLQGIALSRTGNPQGLEVWERALKASPNHAETLYELTCAYTDRDRLGEAVEAGTVLAKCSGWEGRAEALFGTMELVRKEPGSARSSTGGEFSISPRTERNLARRRLSRPRNLPAPCSRFISRRRPGGTSKRFSLPDPTARLPGS